MAATPAMTEEVHADKRYDQHNEKPVLSDEIHNILLSDRCASYHLRSPTYANAFAWPTLFSVNVRLSAFIAAKGQKSRKLPGSRFGRCEAADASFPANRRFRSTHGCGRALVCSMGRAYWETPNEITQGLKLSMNKAWAAVCVNGDPGSGLTTPASVIENPSKFTR